MGNSHQFGKAEKYGYRVIHVTHDSPGEKCGLRASTDYIVKMNRKSVHSMSQSHIMSVIEESEDEPLELEVFDSKTKKRRILILTPSRNWPGGTCLLGVKIQLEHIKIPKDTQTRPLSVKPSPKKSPTNQDDNLQFTDVYMSKEVSVRGNNLSTRPAGTTSSDKLSIKAPNSVKSTGGQSGGREANTPKQRLALRHEHLLHNHQHIFSDIQYLENHDEDDVECYSNKFKIHQHDDDGETGCGDELNIMDFCANTDSFQNDVTCMAAVSPRISEHPHKRSNNAASKIKRALNYMAVAALSSKKNKSHVRNLQVLSPRSPRTCA